MDFCWLRSKGYIICQQIKQEICDEEIFDRNVRKYWVIENILIYLSEEGRYFYISFALFPFLYTLPVLLFSLLFALFFFFIFSADPREKVLVRRRQVSKSAVRDYLKEADAFKMICVSFPTKKSLHIIVTTYLILKKNLIYGFSKRSNSLEVFKSMAIFFLIIYSATLYNCWIALIYFWWFWWLYYYNIVFCFTV